MNKKLTTAIVSLLWSLGIVAISLLVIFALISIQTAWGNGAIILGVVTIFLAVTRYTHLISKEKTNDR